MRESNPVTHRWSFTTFTGKVCLTALWIDGFLGTDGPHRSNSFRHRACDRHRHRLCRQHRVPHAGCTRRTSILVRCGCSSVGSWRTDRSALSGEQRLTERMTVTDQRIIFSRQKYGMRKILSKLQKLIFGWNRKNQLRFVVDLTFLPISCEDEAFIGLLQRCCRNWSVFRGGLWASSRFDRNDPDYRTEKPVPLWWSLDALPHPNRSQPETLIHKPGTPCWQSRAWSERWPLSTVISMTKLHTLDESRTEQCWQHRTNAMVAAEGCQLYSDHILWERDRTLTSK